MELGFPSRSWRIGSSTVLAPLIPKIGSFALVMNYLEVCQQTLLSAAFLISANICYVDSHLFVCLFVSHLNCWLALLQRFTIKKKANKCLELGSSFVLEEQPFFFPVSFFDLQSLLY